MILPVLLFVSTQFIQPYVHDTHDVVAAAMTTALEDVASKDGRTLLIQEVRVAKNDSFVCVKFGTMKKDEVPLMDQTLFFPVAKENTADIISNPTNYVEVCDNDELTVDRTETALKSLGIVKT